MVRFLEILAVLAFVAVGYISYIAFSGSLNTAMGYQDYLSLLSSLNNTAINYTNRGMSVNIQDPNYGGVYTLQRAQAISAISSAIAFDNDTNGYFTIASTKQDTLTLSTTGVFPGGGGTVLPASMGDSGAPLVAGSLNQTGLFQGNIGIPMIVPNSVEIQKQLCLGLLSVKGTSIENELNKSGTVLGIKAGDLLNGLFDGTYDSATKTYNGGVGLQLLNADIIAKGLTAKKSTIKNIYLFSVCEVKSEQDLETLIPTLAGYNGSATTLAELVSGITNISEDDIVAIPQKTSAIVKDSSGTGVFSLRGRKVRD